MLSTIDLLRKYKQRMEGAQERQTLTDLVPAGLAPVHMTVALVPPGVLYSMTEPPMSWPPPLWMVAPVSPTAPTAVLHLLAVMGPP